MIHVPKKQLYVPALSILAIVIILLVLISISTYRNLNRQESVAMDFVHRQGLAILDAIEAGARASMAMHMWQEDSFDKLIEEVGSIEDVAYIYIVDKNGSVSHQSDPEAFNRLGLKPAPHNDSRLNATVRKLKNGEMICELSKQFKVPPHAEHHMMMNSNLMVYPSQNNEQWIVLGLNMDYFQIARKADFSHAIIMAAIVIALGSAAVFFTFIIQNYYIVEKTLRQTQDYTSQVITSLSTGIISIDKNRNITAYNDKALHLLGLNDKSMKGIRLTEILDFNAIGIDRTLATGIAILEKEIDYNMDHSRSVPLSLSVTPLTMETGGWDGAVIQIRDLSELKELEELVRRTEKLAAVGELAAGIAHEVRNPLSSIRGFTQYLGRCFQPGSAEKECSDIVIKEIDRINIVVSDLICFSSPLAPDIKPVNINQLITHTLRLVEADTEAKKIGVTTDISSDLPEIPIDEGQMTQALLNILLNAIQAIGIGGHIWICATTIHDNTQLMITIEDDGPGISEDIKGRIFDPYFTSHENGTGLGLPIVHKIVENHMGTLRITSPLNGKPSGCSVAIEIPIVSEK